MFTGIVEETGVIRSLELAGMSGRISITAKKVLEQTKTGDSIAVNGICLTAVKIYDNGFDADVMSETVKRSSLSTIKSGDKVNLERAMQLNGRFGGHIVSGHIDGTGTITAMERDRNAVWISISAGSDILRFIVNKGSVAIDGISLTVAYIDERIFKVSVIPHTGSETTLLDKKNGDILNLETDILGKYVEKLMNPYRGTAETKDDKSIITLDYLESNGF